MLDIDWDRCALFRTPQDVIAASSGFDQRLTSEQIDRIVRPAALPSAPNSTLIYAPDSVPPTLDQNAAETKLLILHEIRTAVHQALVEKGGNVIRLEHLEDAPEPVHKSDWRICNWSRVVDYPDIVVKLRRAHDGCFHPRKITFDHAHIAPEVTHELSQMPGHYAIVGKFYPDIRPFHIYSKSLSPLQVLNEFIQIINAVNYMHFHGWMHGDISDHNIVWQQNRTLLTDLETATPIGVSAPVLNRYEFRDASYYPEIDNKERSSDGDIFALAIALLRSLAFDKPLFDRDLRLLEKKSDEKGIFDLATKVLTEVNLAVIIPIVCGMLTQSREARLALPIVISQMRQRLKTQYSFSTGY